MAGPDLLALIQQPYVALQTHLRSKGRFSLTPELEKLVNEFVNHTLSFAQKLVAEGATYFRARLHEPNQSKPLDRDQMGAPPLGQARSGRVNPEGIPYLYLADSIATAIAEVRPWKGATISVAEFQVTKPLSVVDLSISDAVTYETLSISKEERIERRRLQTQTNVMKGVHFSVPAHQEDRWAYLASQYLAEMFKNKRVDGLIYGSVLRETGMNLALFDTSSAICGEITRHYVHKVTYEHRDTTHLPR